jgi:drug/metabolite transporter (DMT)-like permease
MTRRTWLLMAGAAATWGASYMFIKVALDDLSEGALVFVRVALGAAVLLPLAARAGALRGLRGRLGWLALITLLQVIAPFLLIAFGERDVPSAMTGILVSSAPLFTAVLATWMDRSERLTGWAAAGVGVGMVGVVLLFGIDLTGDRSALIGGVMILVAALSYAVSALLVKRHLTGAAPVGIVAGQMALASALTLPLLLAAPPTSAPQVDTVLAMLALGTGGTGLAFLWYYTLLAELGPGRASLIAYLAPGFAVAYGALVLDEALTGATLAGLALILLGSWMGTTLSRSGPSRSSAPAPARAR